MKVNNKKMKRVAVVCDPHFSIDTGENLPRKIFEQASREADILLLGGDITDQGMPQEAEAAVKILSACAVPVLAVLGNHDFENGQEGRIREILQSANIHILDRQPFTFGDLGIVGAKGFGGGFNKFLLAPFGEPIIKKFVAEAAEEAFKLESQLKGLDAKKKIALLHYAPIPDTVKGEPPELFPFLGCSRLGETIDRYDIGMVFHGHAHHGAFKGHTARGTPVYNCSIPVLTRQQHGKPYAVFDI